MHLFEVTPNKELLYCKFPAKVYNDLDIRLYLIKKSGHGRKRIGKWVPGRGK